MPVTLYLDFETKDLAITQDLGSGWPYKDKVSVIGYSFAFDDRPVSWREGTKDLEDIIDMADIIVCHNSSYDVGVLHMLGIDYQHKLLIDTLLLAKLFDNRLMKYNLNYLSEKYFNETKYEEDFVKIVQDLKLIKSKAQDPIKYAKINLDIIYKHQPEVVIKYANQDVELTRKLGKYFIPKLENTDYDFYSDLLKSVIHSRAVGVRVDVQKVYTSIELLNKELFAVNQTLSKYLQGRNPNSSVQLAQVCDELKVSYPVTPKLNPSITAKWIEMQEGEFFDSLNYYKKLNKIKNDFLEKTLNLVAGIENCTLEEVRNLSYSRIHPEINIFGATATGRFSGSNPNVQQQPKRDEFSRPLVRSIFIPEEGEDWYCLDFSSQEPRLQVHYASLIGSESGKDMAEEWNLNPEYDMHEAVANIVGISRKEAKAINLGLAYGMGVGKLSKSLKLSTKQASSLINKYHEGAPYLKDLVDKAKTNILRNGYIKTILNRKLYKDDTTIDEDGREQDFSYKAINKLVQGAAADQTMAAMVIAYRYGINIMFPVHDELTLSSNNPLEVLKLKYIMENSFRLLVPSKAEVTKGKNFADQIEEDIELSAEDNYEFSTFKESFIPLKSFI